jgi:hypothetical protein
LNKPEIQNISLATSFEIDNTFDSDKFIKMRLRVCHDGKNPNSSYFEVDDMSKAKESIYNIPILANVIVDENGEVQFGGHDMSIEESKTNEGEYKLIYQETPIGVVPENCNHAIEKFNDKNYVFVDCYIWKSYSNYAQEIIERDKDIKLSMEIMVDEYSYNAKEKYFKISDYRYTGITFLNNGFGTGMENALATTETFAEGNSKEKFIIMMQELKETLTLNNINHSEEKGGKILNEEIKELLAKFNFTSDNLPFDIEGMSFEDLEIKLNELNSETFEDVVEEIVTEEAIETTEPEAETFESVEVEEVVETEVEKFTKTFELSHSDIRYALYQLLSPVESADNEWYFIDQVFDTKFEYENWDGNKIFRQSYTKDGDTVSFDGERIEVFQERLTLEEKNILDKLRGDFELIKADFEKIKSEKESLETDFTKLKAENDSLNEFKLAKDSLEKEEVFAKFEGLTEEEVADIKEHISDHTIEVLEEKLFAIWGKKKMELELGKTFSKKKTDKKDKLVFSIVDGVQDLDAPIYVDIINKHKK